VRVLLAASADIALPCLRILAAQPAEGHALAGLLTSPDSQQGRGMRESANVVAREALALVPGLPVLKPERLGPEARAAVEALRPEILVSFAYGKIFGPKFLGLFPRGGINIHPSLLPRWRGPSPIQAAILNRDSLTGLSIQLLAPEMDTGDILFQEEIPLSGREDSMSLSALAAEKAALALIPILDAIQAGRARPRPQPSQGVRYCRLIGKEDGLIDWKAGAGDIDAMVRAYCPWPLAYSFLRGERLLVHESLPLEDASGPGPEREPGSIIGIDKSKGILVQTGRGLLALTRLQLEKKKVLGHRDFANGLHGAEGLVLGS